LSFGSSSDITRGTADGTDSGFLTLSGGGAYSTTRGGSVATYGNEHVSFPGYVTMSGGNVAGGGALNFFTQNLERMRISYGGSVGIGTTAPGNLLDVNGTAWLRGTGSNGLLVNSSGNVVIGTPSSAASTSGLTVYRGEVLRRSLNDALVNPLAFQKDRAGAILQNSDEMGVITFEGYDGSAYQQSAYIFGKVDGTPGVGDMPGRLGFYTRPSGGSVPLERLRITAAGNVGIGTTSPGYTLDVKSTGTNIARFTGTNSTGCTLSDGGVIACSSDRNLKKNILETELGLDAVMNLRPVEFNWNSQTEGEKKYLGFIAQDVEQVAPTLVTTDSNGYKQLNSIGLIPLVAKAIQEQQGQITMINDQLSMTNGELTTKVTAWDGLFISIQSIIQSIQDTIVTLQTQLGLVRADVDTTKDQVASLSASLQSMNVDYTSWKEAIASGSGVLGASNSASLDGSATVSALLVKDSLTVESKTTTFDLTVLNKLTSGVIEIGAGIDGDEINSSTGIRFQTLAQGPIDFMNGKVVIGIDGSVEMMHLKLNTTDPNTTTIGTAIIQSGQTSMIIDSAIITGKSMVFITPTTFVDKPIFVNGKIPGVGFVVTISEPATEDVEFQWMIVN
jgi:hypothetical protein